MPGPLPPMSTMDTNSNSTGPTPAFAGGALPMPQAPAVGMGAPRNAQRDSRVQGKTAAAARNTTEPMAHVGRGFLRVVTNDEMAASEKETNRDLSQSPDEVVTKLANYIRSRFEKAVRNRRTIGVDDELIRDMRAYNGQYDPTKLQEIRQFGGSEVYSRMMAMKCRGATALLRNVYMNSDRAWSLEPSADPTIPDSIDAKIKRLVQLEVQKVNSTGAKVSQQDIQARLKQLYEATKLSERRKAIKEAKDAERKIDEILEIGQFYHALSDFLSDLPVYKYAVIKGPVTRRASSLHWGRGGKMNQVDTTHPYWERVSPWDIWFSPGATDIANTETFERQRLSVNDLYNMIGLPGYRDADIRDIISAYEGRGFREWIQVFEYERAYMEGRNNTLDDSFINAIEFHGYVLGSYLEEYGVKVPDGKVDPQRPYFVTAWMVDKRVFKVMINPSPRKRVPYYITSFDKQPGTLYGNGIPAMANDITDVINATLRALVNNISLSSGPQVAYDDDLVDVSADDSIYPWKRWRYTGDPSNPNRQPVSFFNVPDNSQSLMATVDKFSTMLDDVSTIPRYLTGGGANSGAGRTASGLSMLINNANKTLQNVADNIDKEIMEPLLQLLYDYIMLTDDTGMLRGDENIVIDGVRQAAKQEQDMTRQLEFLNLINNPNYQSMLGAGEVAKILQKLADNLGMEIKVKDPDDTPGAPPPGLPPGVAPGANGDTFGPQPPPPPPPPPPAPPPPKTVIQLKGNLDPGQTAGALGQPPPAPGGSGPNPTGNNTPNPNPAGAAPGAGGVPGLRPGPQVGRRGG